MYFDFTELLLGRTLLKLSKLLLKKYFVKTNYNSIRGTIRSFHEFFSNSILLNVNEFSLIWKKSANQLHDFFSATLFSRKFPNFSCLIFTPLHMHMYVLKAM